MTAAGPVERVRVPAMEDLLGKTLPVLDDGFVRVVDYMGGDGSVVQAARVSYGRGTRRVSEDRGLIRYLMRHRHTTPFEMAEIKLHVRVPMDCWRQWVRHRTACLAEGTEIHFDLPGGLRRRGNRVYKLKIEEIWRRFQATRNQSRPDKQRNPMFRRDRGRQMLLRQVDEDTRRLIHTRIVDVFDSGIKPVFRMVLADGKRIESTADHRFLFADGWHTLGARTGLRLQNGGAVWEQGEYYVYVNGVETIVPAMYRDKARLNEQRRPRVGWNRLVVAKLVRIERFEYVGLKPTYDLEVEGPYHNFIANGIVTHNSVNEYSTRYSEAIDSAQRTAPAAWRSQSRDNRQGSGEPLDGPVGTALSAAEERFQRLARDLYEERLRSGVAREQARKDLPLSTYTEAYWKIDLHNLLHFLELRMEDHAQQEIREYARTIGRRIVAAWCPLTWEAFCDYRLAALTLSAQECAILQAVLAGTPQRAVEIAREAGVLRADGEGWKRGREALELEEKFLRLGAKIPWRGGSP